MTQMKKGVNMTGLNAISLTQSHEAADIVTRGNGCPGFQLLPDK